MSTAADAADGVPTDLSLEAIERLLELGRSVSPIVVAPESPAWQSSSAGLVVRVLTLADTIVHVSRLSRAADLSILVRCLYEHVVVLAWIAAPRDNSRYEIWHRESLRVVRAWGNEMRDLGAGDITTDGRAWLEEQLPASEPRMPPVSQLARQADDDWQKRLGLTGLNTLTASYTNVYRGGSSFAHPTAIGLHGNRTAAGAHSVLTVEPRGDISAIIGPVFTFLAVALAVSSHTIGRPPLRAIRAAVDQFADAAARR